MSKRIDSEIGDALREAVRAPSIVPVYEFVELGFWRSLAAVLRGRRVEAWIRVE